MDTALRVGIIGGGFMGEAHARAARSAGAEVVGVLASSPESSQRAARSLGTTAFSSVEELSAAADVVHICSPNGLHAEHVQAVIGAGKHVVCEKPLSTDYESAAALVRAADEAGVVASVPFVYRFHPMVRQARHLVQQGEIGRLLTVRGQYLQDWMLDSGAWNWRVDPAASGASRAFGDIGSHLVDLLEFVAGERIRRLNAITSIAYPERDGHEVTTEDAAALTVEFTGGAIGSLMVSQVNAGRKNALTIELAGTANNIVFEQEKPDELWIGGESSTRVISRDATVLGDDAARLSAVPAGHPMGYVDAFAGFVRDTYAAIQGSAPEGLPRFVDGARANHVIDAVLESARTRQWVDVGEVAGEMVPASPASVSSAAEGPPTLTQPATAKETA